MVNINLEIERRKDVWLALSDLFLDTDVSLSYEHIARVCGASEYSLQELKEILESEVAPVCAENLLSIAGEWAGFDEQWLVNSILENMHNKPSILRRVLKLLTNPSLKIYINSHWSKVAPKIDEMRNNA